MQSYTLIIIIVLSVIILVSLVAIFYVYKMDTPPKGNCDAIKAKDPSILWSKDCSYITEKEEDGSIKTPKEPLYLTKFDSSPSSGSAWGANVWYRYKYVNGKTGGYGKFSPWTKSPIIAGGNNFPCKDSNCSGVVKGSNSCKANLPYLKIYNSDYSITSDMKINVYRYVAASNKTDTPTDKTTGKIIGSAFPTGNSNEFVYIDVSSSPCLEVQCSRKQEC